MIEKTTAYDTIPYLSRPFPETRPERLAAIARLFGLQAPAPEGCRVLEIGCSMGGNLLPMAQDLPEARFLGIDASSRQIAEGWKAVERLGLKTLELRQLDILEADELGEFDYIVSHGVFSWVPPRVQAKLLQICQRHLAPNGVAYVSYNTYPGWHIRGVVRDMMLYRGAQFADPEKRLAQAKSLVEFVAQATSGTDTPYQRLLKSELEHIGRMEDYYLHHEHLEEHNEPVYFHEFARRLAVNGLQYLGEADFSMMVSSNFPPPIAKTLHDLGAHDLLQMEQYMDFVRCRYFRKSLVCRSAVRLNRTLTPGVVKGFWFASDAAPAAELELSPAVAQTFARPGGDSVNCKSPLTKLALRLLARRWPQSVPFETLVAETVPECVAAGYPTDAASAERFLGGELLTCMATGAVEWRLSPPGFTATVSEKPLATPLARLEAEGGYRVTTLRGESVNLDEFHRQTLRLLDGTRSRAALAEALMAKFAGGELVLHREGDTTPVREEREMRSLLVTALDKALDNLARKALLRA